MEEKNVTFTSKKFNKQTQVFDFKALVEIAGHQVYLRGYLEDKHGHFRIEDVQRSRPADLAICLTELALREDFYIHEFECLEATTE